MSAALRIANLEQTPKRAARKARRKPKPAIKTDRTRGALTAVMGCGIPALSLALSTCFGTLARSGHYGLAFGAGVLLVAVLGVSLPHLAQAVQDITRCGPRPGWLLAIAFDCCLCFGELVLVLAPSELSTLVSVMMVCMMLLSAALNCWAFFHHAD